MAHMLFRAVFDDWLQRSGALSALPDAPVVDEAGGRLSTLARRGAWLLRRIAAVIRTWYHWGAGIPHGSAAARGTRTDCSASTYPNEPK